jgi:hypothetical protein
MAHALAGGRDSVYSFALELSIQFQGARLDHAARRAPNSPHVLDYCCGLLDSIHQDKAQAPNQRHVKPNLRLPILSFGMEVGGRNHLPYGSSAAWLPTVSAPAGQFLRKDVVSISASLFAASASDVEVELYTCDGTIDRGFCSPEWKYANHEIRVFRVGSNSFLCNLLTSQKDSTDSSVMEPIAGVHRLGKHGCVSIKKNNGGRCWIQDSSGSSVGFQQDAFWGRSSSGDS